LNAYFAVAPDAQRFYANVAPELQGEQTVGGTVAGSAQLAWSRKEMSPQQKIAQYAQGKMPASSVRRHCRTTDTKLNSREATQKVADAN
jgi:hypothetical protein